VSLRAHDVGLAGWKYIGKDIKCFGKLRSACNTPIRKSDGE
jgi:hypothetical protein